jgi:SagB-type dehydrogenase family enzyme
MVLDNGETKSFDEGIVSELFHENSKQYRSDYRVVERIIAMTANPIMSRMAVARKCYPSARKIVLPRDLPKANMSFDEAVLSRRSSRDFGGQPISLLEAAKLLSFANGITGAVKTHDGLQQLFRAAPSGGALYPIEIYFIALNVEHIPAGIYHYDPVGNQLELVREDHCAPDLRAITHTEEIGNASAVLALSGISLKTRVKYGERGYRFMLMEAGHVAQNILLTVNSLQLTAVPIGGFVDDELDQLLGIDGLDEVVLYLVAVGRSSRSMGPND